MHANIRMLQCLRIRIEPLGYSLSKAGMISVVDTSGVTPLNGLKIRQNDGESLTNLCMSGLPATSYALLVVYICTSRDFDFNAYAACTSSFKGCSAHDNIYYITCIYTCRTVTEYVCEYIILDIVG